MSQILHKRKITVCREISGGRALSVARLIKEKAPPFAGGENRIGQLNERDSISFNSFSRISVSEQFLF